MEEWRHVLEHGLSFGHIARRGIQEGEEILIDYGDECGKSLGIVMFKNVRHLDPSISLPPSSYIGWWIWNFESSTRGPVNWMS
jgi:hypothetical protein